MALGALEGVSWLAFVGAAGTELYKLARPGGDGGSGTPAERRSDGE